jgi:SAM-dependent MidA family methyltransferase
LTAHVTIDPRLPRPDDEALRISARLQARIRDELDTAGGWMPFHRYMELALYAPGLGYYAAGSHKLGSGGDFVTAPEVSPLFGRCLARQCLEVLGSLDGGDILEFGAGSGVLATEILRALARQDRLPGRYLILEVSPDLRERQQETLRQLPGELRARVEWIDHLPEPGGFRGVMLANEVLDAMPVEVFRWRPDGVWRRGVAWLGDRLVWSDRPAETSLTASVRTLWNAAGQGWTGDYVSELNPGLAGWVAAVSAGLEAGVLLLIDYGYPRRELYHPERSCGTLIGHYRHRVLDDPLLWPGLVDITASVDFSAVAEAGRAAGLDLLGYTTQAWFLIGTGLEAEFQAASTGDLRPQMDLARQVRMLTLPGEMGERFQVIGLGRGVPASLSGFSGRDLRGRL